MRTSALLTAALIVAQSAPAVGQARTERTVLMSQNERARADQEKYGYNDAVIAGDTIYLSGMVAGQAPGETSLVPAYERVYRRAEAILKRAGASLADVVDVTSFHTDIKAEIDALAEVQKRLLGSPPPAWTAIDVDRLLPDGGLTEIKIIARRPAAAARK